MVQQVIGINDLSLAIDGGVTGVLGPNGAGKSTLFKLMMGRIKPSQGSVRLFGIDPWANTSPYRRVGYVSESEKLYEWMTALDFVTTLARLHGMTREEATERASHVLEFVGLSDVIHKELGKFSKGMRQRVKIAHALVHDPDLIILDEPLHGCDPLARTSIMSVIREMGEQGKTILVSSHILEEIERRTEQIVILHNGRLLAIGNLHAIRDLLDKHPHRILINCEDPGVWRAYSSKKIRYLVSDFPRRATRNPHQQPIRSSLHPTVHSSEIKSEDIQHRESG